MLCFAVLGKQDTLWEGSVGMLACSQPFSPRLSVPCVYCRTAAARGTCLQYPDLPWDFRLKNVACINASGKPSRAPYAGWLAGRLAGWQAGWLAG